MKLNLKWFGVLAIALSLFACKKQEDPKKDKPDDNKQEEVTVPDKQEVTLQVGPAGSTSLTQDIEAYADWTVSADENYSWISVSPTSGSKGKSTLTFVVDANNAEGAKERTATFAVFQGTACIYDIAVVQASPESKVHDGDLQFLQAIVAGKLLGEDTPDITDWVTADDATLTSFPGITFDYDEGKITVVEIGESAPFKAFPEEVNLPNVAKIRQNNNSALAGTLFPKVWNTPKLRHIALSHTKMTGFIPQGFADSPMLAEVYFDDTDFYGALPHIWASKVIEVMLLGSTNNTTFKGEDPYAGDTECPYLGYIVPATLDVILNSERTAQGDKTQMKVGGVKEGHWLGFEKGWGQVRYELFDENAVAGDKETWSDWRLLIGAVINDDDTNTWAWYFSNMGYTEASGYKTYIPKEMKDWDQAVADQFSAAAKAAHDAGTPIDMSQFGVVVEQHDDNIDKGTVTTVDNDFWTIQ